MEFLLCDILMETNNILYNYEEAIWDPEIYKNLTDNVIYEIEVSDDPRLAKAQNLIKRIKTRDYYKQVGDIVVPQSLAA